MKATSALVRWLSGRILPPLAYPVVRGSLHGKRFVLRSAAGEGGGASVYINGVEPRKTRALIEILEPGQIVFDIGANIGYYTLLASEPVGPSGQVLAFEPVVRNLAYLHRHILLNDARNVTIVPVACAERCSLERFVTGTNWPTGHLSSESTGSQARVSAPVDLRGSGRRHRAVVHSCGPPALGRGTRGRRMITSRDRESARCE
jgi:hypothetical protein